VFVCVCVCVCVCVHTHAHTCTHTHTHTHTHITSSGAQGPRVFTKCEGERRRAVCEKFNSVVAAEAWDVHKVPQVRDIMY
jgi:hypothetical protein